MLSIESYDMCLYIYTRCDATDVVDDFLRFFVDFTRHAEMSRLG